MTQEVIFDIVSGEKTIRDLTAEEIAENEKNYQEWIAKKAEEDAIIAAKEAALASANEKLSALGLNAEEIAALRG